MDYNIGTKIRSEENKMTNLKLKSTEEMGNSTVYEYVIENDGMGIGYVEVVTDEDYTTINDIVIEEEFQNKGHGTQTIKMVVKEFGHVILAPTNEDNQRLYERLGCELTSGNLPEIDQGYGIYEI